MDFKLKNRRFIVCGASEGLGNAVARRLVEEEANVIAIARHRDKLDSFAQSNTRRITPLVADVMKPETINELFALLENKSLDGMFLNAGGPPAKSFLETETEDWDEAYGELLRWKVEWVHAFLPTFISQRYGRILLSESASVKQPIPNLVLSNSMRLAVVGMAKSVSEEVAELGITVNVLAPGYHDTAAMGRLFSKKAEVLEITEKEARKSFEEETKTGKLGDPHDFAMLAAWLLSPGSRYITGQTLSVDGGLIKHVMG